MVLETVPAWRPGVPDNGRIGRGRISFHPGEYALEGDGSDGEASVEDLMDEEEEEDDDDDDDDDVDANEARPVGRRRVRRRRGVRGRDRHCGGLAGWTDDGHDRGDEGRPVHQECGRVDGARGCSAENTVALFKGGQFIARAVGIVSSGHATGVYPITAADELAMMRTLVTMQIPAAKKARAAGTPAGAGGHQRRATRAEQVVPKHAGRVRRRGDREDAAAVASQRALAFQSTRRHRALIEKFKQQDTESKAKRRESGRPQPTTSSTRRRCCRAGASGASGALRL